MFEEAGLARVRRSLVEMSGTVVCLQAACYEKLRHISQVGRRLTQNTWGCVIPKDQSGPTSVEVEISCIQLPSDWANYDLVDASFTATTRRGPTALV